MRINHINDIISDYISKREIQGTIFINGKWGSGKTFYWKHTLSPLIQSMKYEGRSNYKTIYVSLNGLTNVKSITSQILSSVLGITDRGKIAKTFFKLAQSIPKVIEKHAIGTEFSQEIYSTIDLVDLMDFNNAILCFDDLERIGGNLKVEDVLGYINLKFVEHYGIRTIFLGDETNIEYSKNKAIKEKIFYREIKFELNIDDIISILADRYKQISKPFASIIKGNSNFIKEVIERCEISNLRSLIFAFDNLKNFYDSVGEELFIQVSQSLINFTLIITAEFKNNQVNATNLFTNEKLEIYQNNPITSSILAKEFNKSDTKDPIPDFVTYFEKFIRKSPILYTFFVSVYKVIITGYFDSEQFKSEVTQIIGSKENQLLSRFWHYQELTNEEFDGLIEQIIELVSKGEISVYQYPALYERLMMFSEAQILKYSEEQLTDIFHKGLLEASKNENYYDEDTFAHGHIFSDSHQYAKVLYKYVQDYQQKMMVKQKRERIEYIYKMLQGSNSAEEEGEPIYIAEKFEPIFEVIDVKKIERLLDKCSNKDLYKFIFFIENKYKDMGNMTHLLLMDESHLQTLSVNLDKKLSSIRNKNLNYYLLIKLNKVVEHILSVFEEYHKLQENKIV